MEVHLTLTVALTAVMLTFYAWLHSLKPNPHMSGDQWYMTQFAFTREPVSAPYCWRPLLPLLARYLGFRVVSYTALLLTPVVIYGYVGGGWRGFACAMMFVGINHTFWFSVKNPQYTEGVGHLLMISGLWAMSAGHPAAYLVLFLAALCRETLTAALGIIALFWNPWLLLPLAVGSAIAYFGRNEDKENRHPLVEKTPYETVKRWAGHKQLGSIHYAHVIQPLRGLAYTVPFMWNGVASFSRLGLAGFVAIWLSALPASGQSRLICYGFGLFIPFAAALPAGWLWFVVLLCWFWPFDVQVFDETGGKHFAFARG